MRAVVQRVLEASVGLENGVYRQINKGLLVYLGVTHNDKTDDVEWLADKIVHLRIFADTEGKMNLSVRDINGQVLLISQFTLYGDCRKGRRPGFDQAADPGPAQGLYEVLIQEIRQRHIPVQTGEFGTHMAVQSKNDGPVTFLLDSRKQF